MPLIPKVFDDLVPTVAESILFLPEPYLRGELMK